MSRKCRWSSYEFIVCTKTGTWNDVGGVYVFAKEIRPETWAAIYIGQADNFCERIPPHEKWAAAVRLGATHVHARVVAGAAKRDALEQELIQMYDPPLNKQLKLTRQQRVIALMRNKRA